MATPTRHLCRHLRQLTRSISGTPKTIQSQRSCTSRSYSVALLQKASRTDRVRSLSNFASQRADQSEEIGEGLDESEYLKPQKPYTLSDLSPAERADYEQLSKHDQTQYMKLQNHFKALFESSDSQTELESLADQADREIEREGGPSVALEFSTARAKGAEVGYWAEDEDDEFGQMEDADNEWSEEHITTVAESELDLHRDIREYTRIAAWDLPLLQRKLKARHKALQKTTLTLSKNTRNHSSLQITPHLSDFATQHTWAKHTQHSTKWWWNSAAKISCKTPTRLTNSPSLSASNSSNSQEFATTRTRT